MSSIIPRGGYWFFTSGVAFHATDAGVIDFSDDGTDAAGDWITIGGGPGPRGQQHSGGFPAKVAGGTPGPDGKLQGGTIVGGKIAGKLGLHGKTTDEVAGHLATVNEHRDAGKSLPEAVKAAHAGGGAATRAGGSAADVPTPPGKDLGNGLYLFEGRADEMYLVDPRRLKEAGEMADKLDAAAETTAGKRGKKNKAETEFARKTAADIRDQIARIGRGETPPGHAEAAEHQAERDERKAESEKSHREYVVANREKNTPKYEHLKAFVDEYGYFPMPGTATKGGRKYLGTSAQRLRMDSDGTILVWTGTNINKPHKGWVALTDDAVNAALHSAGWTGRPKAAKPAPPKDRLGDIKDAAERAVTGGTAGHHEIHAALLKDRPDLTYGEFRDAMSQLRDEGRVVGEKWDKMLDDHPHPETLHFSPDGRVIGYAKPGPNAGKTVFGIVSARGRWFLAAGVQFHEDESGRIDFLDDDATEGAWVTIGGGPGPKGERHSGGFPAKVAGGTPDETGKLTGGTIVGGKLAGRLGLHGKTTDEVVDHLATVNEHRKEGKTLTEAVRAAHASRKPDETKGPGEFPNTERAASWWGPSAQRFHWKSGGLLPSDGRAATTDGRPGIHNATTTPATRVVGDGKPDDTETLVKGGRTPATGPRPRIWKHSPVYLTGLANPKVAGELKDHKGFGMLISAGTHSYTKYIKDFQQFGIDNGCYSKGGAFDEAEFLALVKKATEDPVDRAKCMFAVAPDVYDPTFDNGPGKDKGRGDPLKTIERSLPVLPKIRALGVPAALVAQDGLEDMVDKIPWDAFDVLFVGGSTEFKLLHHEDATAATKALNDPTLPKAERDKIAFEQNRNLKWLNLMWQVRAHGKAIHVGRVNSFTRMAIANTFGAESADGTYLVFGPNTNLPKMKKWQDQFVACTKLAEAIKSGGPIPPESQKTYDKMAGVKPKKARKKKAEPAPAGTAVGFAVRAPGEVFRVLAGEGVEAARAYLTDFPAAELRDLAAFLVRAVGSQTTLAVPAVAVLSLVREAIEAD